MLILVLLVLLRSVLLLLLLLVDVVLVDLFLLVVTANGYGAEEHEEEEDAGDEEDGSQVLQHKANVFDQWLEAWRLWWSLLDGLGEVEEGFFAQAGARVLVLNVRNNFDECRVRLGILDFLLFLLCLRWIAIQLRQLEGDRLGIVVALQHGGARGRL